MTVLTLWKQGKSQREIAKMVNHDRKTIRKIIKVHEKTGSTEPFPIRKNSKLDPYKEDILMYLENNLTNLRVYEEIKYKGCKASYRLLCYYIASLKDRENICIRFHTAPGEEAQVDFGYVGFLPDPQGKKRKAWVFSMRLSYSRLDYAEIVFDQKVSTFILCHINAFKYFGGVPKTVKIDNLKAAILNANFYDPVFQNLYEAFSKHYNFEIVPCRVRKPQEKGKIESSIKFIKNNFFAGRKWTSNKDLTIALKRWLDTTCNNRVHGTTKKIPKELFTAEEKMALIPLPINDFITPEIIKRKVYRDCHITVDKNYYSVPYKYAGKVVEVQKDSRLLKIYFKNKELAVHPLSNGYGNFITTSSHYPSFKLCLPSSAEYQASYMQKMKEIGDYCNKMFELLLNEYPYSWHRTAQGILSLRKLYPDEIIDLACQRAISFNATKYSMIRNICKSGTYNLPLDYERGHHESA